MSLMMIINNAVFAESYKYVAEALIASGTEVVIVTDSQFTLEKYELNQLKAKIFIFSDWKSTNQLLVDNFWYVHADYDRDSYYQSVNKKDNYWAKKTQALNSFFTHIFDTEEIEAIFYENVTNGLAHTAYQLGKERNIPYLGLTASRLPGHAFFSTTDEDVVMRLDKMMAESKTISDENKDYLEKYINNIDNIQPDYMKYNGFSSTNAIPKLFKKRNTRAIKMSLKYSFIKRDDMFQVGNPILKAIYFNLREVKRHITSKRINKFYSQDYQNKRFYLYPLHYHPESSTSIQAKYYDEFNLLKNIAYSLPSDEYLVIKDHISASGYESYNFYKKLSQLPNVILAAPWENAKKLIKQSLGVMTLTSTVGYEAIILNKPVVVFGHVFYMNHPLVYKALGYHCINDGFNFIKNEHKNYRDITVRFLAAYKELSFLFDCNENLNSDAKKERANILANIILSYMKS